MSLPSIRLEGICKSYKLYRSPRDRLKEAFHPLGRRYHQAVQVLDSVDLEVFPGETIGILGRNGSGKSTLLQMIAGLLTPSGGSLAVAGRVAALLELGAGFKPEFTGRENAMFQGRVLGLPRVELERRMPEIEAFADIGQFFDQPVRIYSSGMFVRVAFSVATSVDADILLVDEALAVGDSRFQEKCYARMRGYRNQGKTIVFVSHSVETISALCDRALILEGGRVYAMGEPKMMVDAYLRLLFNAPSVSPSKSHTQPNAGCVPQPIADAGRPFDENSLRDHCPLRDHYNPSEVRIENGSASIVDFDTSRLGNSLAAASEKCDTRRYIDVKVSFLDDVGAPIVGFEVKSTNGVTIYGTNTHLLGIRLPSANRLESTWYRIAFDLPLVPGDYFVDLGVAEDDGSPGGRVLSVRRSVIHLTIVSQVDRVIFGLVDLRSSITLVEHSTGVDEA